MIYPTVTMIILNLNGKDIISECLKSIENIDYPNKEVVIVDNGSKDKSQNFIKDNFSYVHLIENNANKGVAEGQNIGIEYALKMDTDYIFILNNDIKLEKGVLNELLKVLKENDKIGIVGPIMYWIDNPKKIQSAGGMINWKTGTIHHLNANEINPPLSRLIEIDYMGLPFLSSSLIKEIGLYNSKYFAYYEDMDFCTRVKKAGYKIICVPNAKVWHFGSHTTQRINGFVTYYTTRNKFWFMKQYSNKKQYLSFLLYYSLLKFWYDLSIQIIYSLYKKDTISLINYIKAIKDGLNL
jgi:GT2 family glycosyltransferase